MKRVNLEKYSYRELTDMAQEMGLRNRRSKVELMRDISECFKEYESYKKEKLDRYSRLRQLGEKGKEGTTYLVEADGEQYAMKTFRKQKSSAMLRKEAELQNMAAEMGASPKVIDIDTVSKYIVMEKLDRHLYDLIKKNGGALSQNTQKQIISIYKKLDTAGVFHGDANLLNYMFKGRQLYIIDFGMAKEITNSLVYKLGTNTPNLSIMTLGLVLKLKEIGAPRSAYSYLSKQLSEEQRSQFGL
jgi:tRNA A-37 threonylcarbamoyl transferase component Bud32